MIRVEEDSEGFIEGKMATDMGTESSGGQVEKKETFAVFVGSELRTLVFTRAARCVSNQRRAQRAAAVRFTQAVASGRNPRLPARRGPGSGQLRPIAGPPAIPASKSRLLELPSESSRGPARARGGGIRPTRMGHNDPRWAPARRQGPVSTARPQHAHAHANPQRQRR
jgi:hypothetical protein